MEKKHRIIVGLILSLIIWSGISLYVFSIPVYEEPENLPDETWSYYRDQSAFEVFIVKNKEILLLLFLLVLIVPDIIILIIDHRKKP